MKNFRPFSSATRLLFCAICLALLSPSPASAQSADDYLKQAKKAEYDSKEQFDLYMKAAELGNAEAQYWVGLRYDIGSGVAEDNYEAFKWYKKSADQGYAEGLYRVGEAYMFGIGMQKDYKMAEKYYLSAAYKGYYYAYFKLGLLYKDDLKNKNEAIYWFKKDVDSFYAEYGELCPTSLECLRELGVYYHPEEKSSTTETTQTQTQQSNSTTTSVLTNIGSVGGFVPVQQQTYVPVQQQTDNSRPVEMRYQESVWVDVDCHHCLGSGRCQSCNGSGLIYNSFGVDRLDCPNCRNGNCQYCNGSGKVKDRKTVERTETVYL